MDCAKQFAQMLSLFLARSMQYLLSVQAVEIEYIPAIFPVWLKHTLITWSLSNMVLKIVESLFLAIVLYLPSTLAH